MRKTVEELLNGLLEEEAGDLVGAERYDVFCQLDLSKMSTGI